MYHDLWLKIVYSGTTWENPRRRIESAGQSTKCRSGVSSLLASPIKIRVTTIKYSYHSLIAIKSSCHKYIVKILNVSHNHNVAGKHMISSFLSPGSFHQVSPSGT